MSERAIHDRTPLKLAGALLFTAGAAILMGIITAEALYPAAYSTFGNTISDLGGTRPPDSVVLQPSAAIFDITMLVTGAMIVVAAWLVHRSFRRRAVTISLACYGIGVFGVGVLPPTTIGKLAMTSAFPLFSAEPGRRRWARRGHRRDHGQLREPAPTRMFPCQGAIAPRRRGSAATGWGHPCSMGKTACSPRSPLPRPHRSGRRCWRRKAVPVRDVELANRSLRREQARRLTRIARGVRRSLAGR